LSNVCSVLIKQVTFWKRSHTTAYDIRVCERISLYVRHKWGTFLIRWQTSVLYAETNFLGDIFKIYQRMRAHRIYVTHTLTMCTTHAGYARHTLYMLKLRYSCVLRTLSIQACKGVWSTDGIWTSKGVRIMWLHLSTDLYVTNCSASAIDKINYLYGKNVYYGTHT